MLKASILTASVMIALVSFSNTAFAAPLTPAQEKAELACYKTHALRTIIDLSQMVTSFTRTWNAENTLLDQLLNPESYGPGATVSHYARTELLKTRESLNFEENRNKMHREVDALLVCIREAKK